MAISPIAPPNSQTQTTIQDLPEDCMMKTILFSASVSKCDQVCKSWRKVVLRCYGDIFVDYQRDKKIFPFIPTIMPVGDNRFSEAVKQTYLNVIASTHKIPQIQDELARLDPSRSPLDLQPVAKIVEDANTILFFKELAGQGVHQMQFVEGNLAHQSAAIQDWMKEYPGLWEPIKVLNFPDPSLTFLPPSIGHFTNLTELSHPKNRLVTLSQEITQLQKLNRLLLPIGQLKDQSSKIFQLINLTGLDLTENGLSTIAPSIGQLTNLRWLFLANNNLEDLPQEIGHLREIRMLKARGNRLKSLPSGIGQLTSLVDLDISGNRLTTIPPEIGRLRILQIFSVANNELVSLPKEIGNLRALVNFWLHDNRELTALPKEICQLRSLDFLELSHIPLADLKEYPRWIELIPNLCALDKIIGVFKEAKTEEALKIFEELPIDTKNAIYKECHELIDFKNNNYYTCAEDAFLRLEGQLMSNENRIMAIENFIHRNRPPK